MSGVGRRLLSAALSAAGAPARVAPSDAKASGPAASLSESVAAVLGVSCHTCPSSLETDDDF